jgi:hypothetical protein
MAHDFDQLAAEFCGIAGAPVPDMRLDAAGVRAFTAVIGDVPITIGHDQPRFPAHVFMVTSFGAVPQERESAIQRELLEANAFMLQPHAAFFARDPQNGEILLQSIWPLAGIAGQDLWNACVTTVEAAVRWRETGSIEPVDASAEPIALDLA